jgi:hypothetical protein
MLPYGQLLISSSPVQRLCSLRPRSHRALARSPARRRSRGAAEINADPVGLAREGRYRFWLATVSFAVWFPACSSRAASWWTGATALEDDCADHRLANIAARSAPASAISCGKARPRLISSSARCDRGSSPAAARRRPTPRPLVHLLGTALATPQRANLRAKIFDALQHRVSGTRPGALGAWLGGVFDATGSTPGWMIAIAASVVAAMCPLIDERPHGGRSP